VEDEYDVQTVLHGVLRMFYDDVRPEDYVPEQAGSKSRVDFRLKLEQIVIETKMTRANLGAKRVGGGESSSTSTDIGPTLTAAR
jgi:hypothetical protein